jgi:precorrin-2 dehydrogenase / sirohydrochlorin ferrochelatase
VVAFGYPVSLELEGRLAAVIGDEAVAHGKVAALLGAGARVRVVAREPATTLSRLQADPRAEVRRRGWLPEDLDGAFVCVATDQDPSQRAAIRREARARGVLVNMVDDIPNCDFAIPAVVRRGDLAMAISTGGRSPALARRLRERLSEEFGPEWSDVLDVLGDVRMRTLPELPDIEERARRWHDALDLDELVEQVRAGRTDEATARLVDRLLRPAVGVS